MPTCLPGRTTLAQKIDLLGLGASRQATLARLEEYIRLFAYRYTNGIVTRVGQGPSAWTKLPKRLGMLQVVRHLAGNRLPGLEPIWYGARSLDQSRWFCIDVDADHTPEQLVAAKYDLAQADDDMKAYLLGQERRCFKPKPTYAERLSRVETALRRTGIVPSDPRQVLALPTPSGGRHLYVFLDGQYHLETIYDLLASAGLQHVPGEIEFFPAVNRGLRLPFGHLPNRPNDPNDPNAWIQFIDDYANHRIHRFSLASLRTHLDHHHDRWQRQKNSRRSKLPSRTPSIGAPPFLGIPKSHRAEPPNVPVDPTNGLHSFSDAETLLRHGIQQVGTRNLTLNLLTAHLIWFRHLSAEQASALLITWAMDPRHASKDIQADLANGTNKVPKQIKKMCHWYEAKQQNAPPTSSPRFTTVEIEQLKPSLRHLDTLERIHQAEFLLHLLNFAKRHGTPTPDGAARDVGLAINAIVRKWPGCHHMNYKSRINHAIAAGVITLVKEKLQLPHGKGRARTYRLSVPGTSQDETLDHAAALVLLVQAPGLDVPVEVKNTAPTIKIPHPPEHNDANHPQHTTNPTPKHPPALPEARTHPDLGTSPHQRDPQRHATRRLPGLDPRDRRARHHQRSPERFTTSNARDLIAHERARLTALRSGCLPASVTATRWGHNTS